MSLLEDKARLGRMTLSTPSSKVEQESEMNSNEKQKNPPRMWNWGAKHESFPPAF